MTASQYITVRETAQLLNISEKKVMDIIEQRKLQAYRIADKFLRLKKAEVLNLLSSGHIKSENTQIGFTKLERIKDFLYFNDFYILSSAFILILIFIIFYT